MWPALLRDLQMVMWHAARSLALTLFLISLSFLPSAHPADLTLLPTLLPRQQMSPQLLLSNGVKSPLSLLFIPLPPPPLQGLNPLSVPAGSLNYSVEHCCSPQRPISETVRQKEGKLPIDSVMAEWEGDGVMAADVWLGASQETPHLSSSSSSFSALAALIA